MRLVVNMSQEEKKAIVTRAVAEFAKAEVALEQFVAAMRELDKIYHDGAALDMASGGWVVKECARFNRFVGRAGELQEDVYAAHERGTAVAKANDADSALPPGYAVVLGGGR